MNQDPNNNSYNPQNSPLQDNNSKNNQNQQQSFNTPSQVHFSPSNVNLEALSAKSQSNGSINNSNQQSSNYQQPTYGDSQYQPNNQFSNYNPYQNPSPNLENIQSFTPQDNFDTGFNNQMYNQPNNFNQAGIEQYKSSTPQFNANDPYLMPSTNPENDDLDEPEADSQEKPKRGPRRPVCCRAADIRK